MNAEDLLKDIPLITPDEQHDLQQESKRERISAIIAGGGSRQYLGRELQLSDIFILSHDMSVTNISM